VAGDETGRRTSILSRYDALVMDLDGVVYRGDHALPGAARALPEIRHRIPVLFLTNNSARTPAEVADRLVGMGIQASADEVLTSAVATAAMLRREGAAGSEDDVPGRGRPRTAYVIGERGIRQALEGAGVLVVDGEPDRTDLVVVGWDRDVDYARLRTASLLVQRGARLVATNPDTSYPAQDGLWPGAGALLSVITTTTGAAPVVVGKPSGPMFEAAATMTGAARPLMVGDRLDTDIAGAAAAGWDSMLVLSGASTTEELPAAAALPTYLSDDLAAVLDHRIAAHARPAAEEDLGAILALLEESGLSAGGAADRVTRNVVVDDSDEDGPGGLAATACLDTVGGHRYLRSVAVRKDLRGQGLGLLVAAAAVRARGPAAPNADPVAPERTYLLTDDAAGFFSRLGFRAIDRSDLPDPIADAADQQGCARSATPMALASRPA
jgi:4-nitrophenyl phosphatase